MGMFRPLFASGSFVLAALLLLAACAPSASPTPATPIAASAQPTVAPRAPSSTATPSVVAPRPGPGAAATPAAPVRPTPAVAAPQPKRGGTLRLIMAGDVPHWDPHRSTGTTELWEYLGDYLVNYDPRDGTAVPELIEKWEYPTSTTLVLRVRQGVKFHNMPPVNGREFTADDVVWNIKRLSRPGALYIWKSNFEEIANVETVDKYTVKITLKRPFAPMLSYLRGNVLPTQPVLAHEVEEKLGGEDAYRDLMNARSTGSFMIKEFTYGVGGLAVRNPDYWRRGLPYMDAVQIVLVQDAATLLAAIRTGRADYGAGSAGVLSLTQKQDIERTNPAIRFGAMPDPYVLMLMPNVTRKPYDDVRLRKAMFLAADRQEAMQVNVGGGGHLSGPMSPKLFPGWTWSEEELLKREGYRPKGTPEGQRDIAEAQRLMRELGYGPDKPLVLEADATESYAFINRTNMEVAKSQWKKIWIDVRIKIIDRALSLQQEAKGDFFFRARGLNAAPEPDAQLYTRHHSKGGRNFQKLSDPELDKLLDAQRAEIDVAKRKQLVMQAQERLWSLYPQVWLHTREAFVTIQPWIKGLEPTPYRRWGDPAVTWIDKTDK